MTDKALLEGAEEERAEEEDREEDREQDLEEGGWAAQDRALVRQGSAYARNAALLPPTKQGYPVTRYTALSVAHPWLENNTR